MNSPAKMKKIAPKLATNSQFQALLQDIRGGFSSQDYSATSRVTILFNMQKMDLQDEDIL